MEGNAKLIRKNRKQWMKDYGATSVGVGRKITNRKLLDEESVVFFVPFKPKNFGTSLLSSNGIKLIPRWLEGYRTDVVQVTFKTRDRPIPDDRRIRPISGSLASINVNDRGTGTTGYINKSGLGLSNCHVWARASTEVSNLARVGDKIIQPGAHGTPPGKSPEDDALELLRWVTLKVSDEPNGCPVGGGVGAFFSAISKLFGRRGRFKYVYGDAYNRVDGAVAQAITDYVPGIYKTIDPEHIIVLRAPPSVIPREIGDPRAGVGRTTGYREGELYMLDLTTTVGMYAGNVEVMFEDQVAMTGDGGKPFSGPGDSGRQIYHPIDMYPTELLFAGGRTNTGIDITIGNRIEDVIAELDYSFP